MWFNTPLPHVIWYRLCFVVCLADVTDSAADIRPNELRRVKPAAYFSFIEQHRKRPHIPPTHGQYTSPSTPTTHSSCRQSPHSGTTLGHPIHCLSHWLHNPGSREHDQHWCPARNGECCLFPLMSSCKEKTLIHYKTFCNNFIFMQSCMFHLCYLAYVYVTAGKQKAVSNCQLYIPLIYKCVHCI